MVVRRRKKHEKFRGKRHYHGSHKKHKGAGGRGGVGKAGMHKHKWSYTVKYEPRHFGKRGFKRHPSLVRKLKTINLGKLDLIIDNLKDRNVVEEEDGKIKINLIKLGYDKLLGKGRVTKPLIIECKHFSKSAIKKLEETGGSVIER